MNAVVIPLHGRQVDAADAALAEFERTLSRSALSSNTVRAYRRQARAYVDWLAVNVAAHPDAFQDSVGAEAAVTVWRRHLLTGRAAPATVNQALAAVALLYQEGTRIRIGKKVKRARVSVPDAPDALTVVEEGAVKRAADRRGVRDGAVVAFLLGSGARIEECAGLAVVDVAITARTGTARLLGKGTETRTVSLPPTTREKVTAWLDLRTELLDGQVDPGGLWLGRSGVMTVSGLTKVVLAVGRDAGLPGLRPHRLRHTYATRLRESGMDVAQISRAMGHTDISTTQRYFRASAAEVQTAIDEALG